MIWDLVAKIVCVVSWRAFPWASAVHGRQPKQGGGCAGCAKERKLSVIACLDSSGRNPLIGWPLIILSLTMEPISLKKETISLKKEVNT